MTADSSAAVFNEKRVFYGRDRRARALTRRRSLVISTATPHIRPRMRVYLLVLASESLRRNSRVYTRAGRTINTAPISFSWRNNPLSGATSYRARASRGGKRQRAFSATEFCISLGGRARESERGREESAVGSRGRFLAPWPNKNENMTRAL